jgi:hypothetical protein
VQGRLATGAMRYQPELLQQEQVQSQLAVCAGGHLESKY